MLTQSDIGRMDLEAEYDNRARVPEHPEIIEAWQTHASHFRASAGGELDVPYGSDERHVCDIFRSKEETAKTMVVFIHGGYWRTFDKSYFSHMARGLEIHGVGTAIPSYRLCPAVAVTDIIDDMRRFCVWLWNRHKRHLVVAGHSAGGHLAACMVATDWSAYDAPDDLVRAGFAISGLYDLRPLIATSLNETLHLNDASARAASPLLWPTPADQRIEVWVSEHDSPEFNRQSRSLAACWAGAGARTKFVEIPGRNHFNAADGLGDPASDITNALAGLC